MALTRLLRAKQTIQFSRIGYTNSARWCSSSSANSDGEIGKSTSSKKGGAAAREQKEKAVESYVNKYMQENPGVFPKPSYVQKEIGGSWYILKNILQNLKEKILGNNDTQLHDPNPIIDSKATEGPHKTEVHGDKITVSPIVKDNLSGNSANQKATKAISEKDYSDNLDLNPNIDSKVMNGPNGDKITVSTILKDNPSGKTANQKATKAIIEKDYSDNLDLNPNIDSKAMNGPNGDKITVLPILKDTLSGNTVNQTVTKAATEKSYLGNLDRNPEIDSKSMNGPDGTNFDKEEIPMSSVMNDLQSMITTNPPASKSITENGCFINVELSKSSVKTKDSVVESKIIAKILREEIGQANNRSDIPKITDFKSGEKVRPLNFDSNLISIFDKLSSDKPRKDSFVGRLRQIGYGNPEEKKMNNSSPDISNILDVRKSQATVKHSVFTKSQDFSKTLQELVEMKLTSNGYINNQSSPSKGPPQKESLIHTNEKVTHVSSQEYSVSGEAKSSDLKGLVDCIKVLPIRQEGRIVNNSTHMENKKGIDTNFSALNRPNSTRVPLKVTENESSQSQRADQNKIKLMFLPKTATKIDIYNAFRSSGDIESVEFIYDKGKNGSGLSASVCFKTVKGVKKALELRHVIIHDQKVAIAESPTTPSNTLPIPNLISNAFSGLIKNPKRTVVIKQLTPDICYHHLEEAFSFCDSKISAVVFGSSKSVAYVEFKTEEGKEKALTKHSVDVLGKQLLITRIDAPRTTVVRLSNLSSSHEIVHKLKPICESFGRITTVKFRHSSILDVYFELNEWPNMLNIVNRLNGMEIGAERLVAAPAPVYPPEILRALWNHPEEKRHVKAVVRGLIQKFGESSINMVALANTAAKLYRD